MIILAFILSMSSFASPVNVGGDSEVNAWVREAYVYPYGVQSGWFFYRYGTNSAYLNEFISHSNSRWNATRASVRDNKGRQTCRYSESMYLAQAEIYRFSGRTASYYQGFRCYEDRW